MLDVQNNIPMAFKTRCYATWMSQNHVHMQYAQIYYYNYKLGAICVIALF